MYQMCWRNDYVKVIKAIESNEIEKPLCRTHPNKYLYMHIHFRCFMQKHPLITDEDIRESIYKIKNVQINSDIDDIVNIIDTYDKINPVDDEEIDEDSDDDDSDNEVIIGMSVNKYQGIIDKIKSNPYVLEIVNGLISENDKQLLK